jgi:glycerophosphoryl diester phosphodiesterase
MPALTRAASVIAHRGASAYRPEHTLDAYDCALAMGADRLELDVRSAADGTLVVLHDATLARTAGDLRPVAGLTSADLLALDPARRPLTLDEVLGRYGADAAYLIEIKDPRPGDAERVAGALARHDLAGRASVQSFDRGVLHRLRAMDPSVPLALLYRESWLPAAVRHDLAEVAGWAAAIAPAAVSVDAALVLAAHRLGLTVQVWTVNDVAEMERLLALGVDALITDVPDRARAHVDGLAVLAFAA